MRCFVYISSGNLIKVMKALISETNIEIELSNTEAASLLTNGSTMDETGHQVCACVDAHSRCRYLLYLNGECKGLIREFRPAGYFG
jgi:hypothetical protein